MSVSNDIEGQDIIANRQKPTSDSVNGDWSTRLDGFPSQPPKAGMRNLQAFHERAALAEATIFYSSRLVGTGREMVQDKMRNYQTVNTMRHYFSVDTNYVWRKLRLLLFPFYHKDWTRKMIDFLPAKPRNDINSPDLYIPLMGYVTYLLVVGLVNGVENKFNTEKLALVASQSVALLFSEVCVQLMYMYLANIQAELSILDIIAFSGYKFIGIILSAILGLAFYKKGYYSGLIYCSAACSFYMVRAFRYHVLTSAKLGGNITSVGFPNGVFDQNVFPDTHQGGSLPETNSTSSYRNYKNAILNKRQIYFLIYIAISQPIFIWWLSHMLNAPL